jgi:hypothetical protein
VDVNTLLASKTGTPPVKETPFVCPPRSGATLYGSMTAVTDVGGIPKVAMKEGSEALLEVD